MEGKRFAFMDSSFKNRSTLLGTRRKFARHGEERGVGVGAVPAHGRRSSTTSRIVHTVATDVFNHAPAKLFMNTGSPQFGRPSMGAWVTYGIGSESSDLPGFVVLQSGPRGPRGGAVATGAAGFCPASYQGVPLPLDAAIRSSTSPAPPGITAERQRDTIDAVRELNLKRLVATGDPEISTRIAPYEMAYRMQTSAPELIDLQGESQETLRPVRGRARQAVVRQQLPARPPARRARRAVRPALSHQLGQPRRPGREPRRATSRKSAAKSTRPCAALVKDLKQRGLLDDTLVDLGRRVRPHADGREPRHHRPQPSHRLRRPCGWPAAASRPGQVVGQTDELGFCPVEDPMHVHDLHATMLHLLGLEHTKLTFKFQGRDFRLTDVKGNVVKKLLA